MVGTEASSEVFDDLSPPQEHFLKKYLLEQRLRREIYELTKPDCCHKLGYPFAEKDGISSSSDELPLVSFFFQNYCATFPFIANNLDTDQITFWQQTVQPFVESFIAKGISGSDERKENATKRRQVNKKFLLGLLLFYNLMIITEKDLQYLQSDHIKVNDGGGLHKLKNPMENNCNALGGVYGDESRLKFNNDVFVNIVAVRQVSPATDSKSWSFNVFKSNEPRHNYEFVVQVTYRRQQETTLHEELRDGENEDEAPGELDRLIGQKEVYDYTTHYVVRYYDQFQALARNLKKDLPGLAAGVAHLPRKSKTDEGVKSNDVGLSNSQTDIDTIQTAKGTRVLARERLRLSLRGYIRSLTTQSEIVHSRTFKDFLVKDKFDTLTEDDIADQNRRKEHETNMINVQKEFQAQTSRVIMQLSRDFDAFKQKLVVNPLTLRELFDDIGKTGDVKKLSPLLATFNEWCKLETAATIYQIFLGLDGLDTWLRKCKKLHSLFPYTIVYGVLKLANPAKIISRVVDLLLVEMPLMPWLKASDKKVPRNLLSLIFLTMIDEDLSGCEKELAELRDNRLGPAYASLTQRLDKYAELTAEDIDNIKQESWDSGNDFFYTILFTEAIGPAITDALLLEQLEDSYVKFKTLEDHQDPELCKLYSDLSQYWHLVVRRKDMDLVKLMWQEPELTRLIKRSLTIFYLPLINLFAKSNMHIVFLEFKRFLDDLFKELLILSEQDMYWTEPILVFQRIKAVLDRHDHTVWNFIHSTYVNDEQHLFLGLIEWIEKFLIMLRLKFDHKEKVCLKLHVPAGIKIDTALFNRQLKTRVATTTAKRHLYKQLLESKAIINSNNRDDMDERWDEINGKVFGDMNMSGFGVDADDLEDIQILSDECDLEGGDENAEFKRKLKLLEKQSNDAGTSEMDKLDPMIKDELKRILRSI